MPIETTSSPRPRAKNDHVLASTLLTSQAKFWPKKPVRNDSGRKIVAMIVSCFEISPWRLATVDRYMSVAPLSRSR